ncbi:hypothetical protein M8C21_005926, partial [Ambrosia artemisiifolia]
VMLKKIVKKMEKNVQFGSLVHWATHGPRVWLLHLHNFKGRFQLAFVLHTCCDTWIPSLVSSFNISSLPTINDLIIPIFTFTSSSTIITLIYCGFKFPTVVDFQSSKLNQIADLKTSWLATEAFIKVLCSPPGYDGINVGVLSQLNHSKEASERIV